MSSAVASARRGKTLLCFVLFVVGAVTEGFSIALLLPSVEAFTRGLSPTSETWQFISAYISPDYAVLLAVASLAFALACHAYITRIRDTHLAALLYDGANRIRLDLFESLARADWGSVSQRSPSSFSHVLNSQVDRIHQAFGSLVLLAGGCLSLLIYVTIATAISAPMTAVALVTALVIAFSVRRATVASIHYGARVTELKRDQFRMTDTFLAGIKITKFGWAGDLYRDLFFASLSTLQSEFSSYLRTRSNSALLTQLSVICFVSILILVAKYLILVETSRLVVLIFIFVRISGKTTSMQRSLNELLSDLSAYEDAELMRSELDAAREGTLMATTVAPRLQRGVAVRSLGFRYPHNDRSLPALTQVTFDIPARKVTALVGPSGSGKTTLADIIAGLIRPSEGSVAIDDLVLTASISVSWRERVAYVPQDSVLFDNTIRWNVGLGRSDTTDAAIWRALRLAEAQSFVERLDRGLDTEVGSRGTRFSGGERQRLALARALISTPDLLVLDEVTSALDPGTEASILKTVRGLAAETTVLIISHRTTTLQIADLVIALNQGRVVEHPPMSA